MSSLSPMGKSTLNGKEKGILKSNLKGNKFNQDDSRKKALENLDQMVKNIYDTTEIPGMCFMPPPNSKSESNIGYLQASCTYVELLLIYINFHYHDFPFFLQFRNRNFEGYCPSTYRQHRCMPNSHSFSYNKDHCCRDCNHHQHHHHATNGRHHHKFHHHNGHCSIL
jgi:hypothetical protein